MSEINKKDLPSIEKRWEKYYPEGAKNFYFPKMNIYDLVYEENRNRKDNIAIEYEGNYICFGEFFDKVDEKTEFLKNKGIKENDIVTMSMLMSPEFVYDWYALGRINAISNLIDPRTSIDGIKKYLNEAESKYIISTNIFLPKILKALDNWSDYYILNYSLNKSAKKMPFLLGKLSDIMELYGKFISLNNNKIDVDCKTVKSNMEFENNYIPNQPLTIVHTGGTTGVPKGVLLSHDNYNAMAYEYMKSEIGFSPKDRFLLIMPPWISYGSGMLHMSLVTGMKSTIISKLDSKKMPNYLLKYKPQWFAGVPTHYEIIANSKLIKEKGINFLKAGAVGGDAMSEELYNKVNKYLLNSGASQGVYPGYALTEVTSAFAVKQLEDYKPGSVGIPLPGCTVGIFKYDEINEITLDEELEYNKIGEICIRTPNQMLGYLKNEEMTKNVLKKHKDNNIWVHTGDLGYIDEDGCIFVTGRIKEMIIRYDGFKIYPSLIEEIVNKHEAVVSCKVVGVDDLVHNHGQVPKVFVVLKKEYNNQINKIFKELKNNCSLYLSAYYTENISYEKIDKLPLTPIGKVDFNALKEKNRVKTKTLKKNLN